MDAKVLEEMKQMLAEATPGPWIVVRSEAHKRDGTICGQTEVKYFITTEELRRENDWIFETHDKDLAALICALRNNTKSLVDDIAAALSSFTATDGEEPVLKIRTAADRISEPAGGGTPTGSNHSPCY